MWLFFILLLPMCNPWFWNRDRIQIKKIKKKKHRRTNSLRAMLSCNCGLESLYYLIRNKLKSFTSVFRFELEKVKWGNEKNQEIVDHLKPRFIFCSVTV